MKKYFSKKFRGHVSLFLAIFIVISIFSAMSGCQKKDDKKGEQVKKLFDEPVTFSVMMGEHPSQRVNPDGLKYKLITDYTNVTLDFNVIPASTYKSKKIAALASGTVSDFTVLDRSDISNYASTGVFLKLDDYLETDLVNYYNLVKEEKNWKKTLIDGNCYALAQMCDSENLGGIMPVMRLDILEENNIAVPKTFDEWFTCMKKLKAIYPNSTPFSGRTSGYGFLWNMEDAMGCRSSMFYDYDTEKYVFGALTNEYKNIMEFWIKCWNEGIIDPNYKAMNANTWDEGINSNKVFFWYDNAGFSTIQTKSLRKSNPNANMTAINLMENSEGKKQGMMYNNNQYTTWYAMSSKSDKTDKMIKFANWMYSEEAMYIGSYGEEGKTYTRDDDGKVTIEKSIADKYSASAQPDYDFMSDYGLGQLSFTFRFRNNGELEEAIGNAELTNKLKENFLQDYNEGYYNPIAVDPSLPVNLSIETSEILRAAGTLLATEIPKFIEGKRPMTEWNQFVSDLKQLGVEKAVNAYNDALK